MPSSEGVAGEPRIERDPGLAALILIAQFHNIPADATSIRHKLGRPTGPLSPTDLHLAAKDLGLKVRGVRVRPERLAHTPLPCLALNSDGRHFVLARVDDAKALIFDPATGQNQILTRQQLDARWDGAALLFASRASLSGELARFDFSWFIPAVVKYRRLLLEVF